LKLNDGTEVFQFSIEKVWKRVLKMCGNPAYMYMTSQKFSLCLEGRGHNSCVS